MCIDGPVCIIFFASLHTANFFFAVCYLGLELVMILISFQGLSHVPHHIPSHFKATSQLTTRTSPHVPHRPTSRSYLTSHTSPHVAYLTSRTSPGHLTPPTRTSPHLTPLLRPRNSSLVLGLVMICSAPPGIPLSSSDW